MSGLALVGRRGAYPQRWGMNQARSMYAEGVKLSASDMLQVWRCTPAGELLGYDSARTRKLTDKIVEAQVVRLWHSTPIKP